jgi:hypothetical protein
MDGMSIAVTLNVTRDGRRWVGLPDGYPGSCMGVSIMELLQEAQAILPYMVSGPDSKPVRDIVVDCVFTDIPVELQDDVRRYHELQAQRRDIDHMLSDLGARTARGLRSIAGFTDEDSAAALGISRQRVNQLRNAPAVS